MYQRNSPLQVDRSQCNAAKLDCQNGSMETSTVRGGTITKRKMVIWLVVLVQVCFVGCFWLFPLQNTIHINPMTRHKDDLRHKTESSWDNRINFVKKKTQHLKNNDKNDANHAQKNITRTGGQFEKDFILGNNDNRLINETGIYLLNDIHKPIWCFREGTVNSSTNSSLFGTSANLKYAVKKFKSPCICQIDWHGEDCGQPEVIWRTYLTSKNHMQLQRPKTDGSTFHKLVYMLDGNFFSLDFLELQIKSVSEVVDYFIIKVSNRKTLRSKIKSIEKRLRTILKFDQYFVHTCEQIKFSSTNKSDSCTSRQSYGFVRNVKQNIKPTDIFIYTNDRIILNSKALKFIKYYYKSDADFATAFLFRLKYVVYGFYWQHSKRTFISGLMSSFATLDNRNGGNGDPNLLLQKLNIDEMPAIIIGDLNHFGGWFCKYCFHPEEIIIELNTISNSTSHVNFPNGTRNQKIDVNYMQKLIAQGLHIDDKTELIKLRQYSDKYYAPEYAENYNWKYSDLLVNVYVSLEDDIEDVEEY